ncbi:MAG TPA: PA2779 family protein [Steroidobacteraceae bacterium]|nr:PA2779 family protein [Steroidobacteraceae bacterium]HRX87961.1 PA2779 family protein [Steroidobacteraceae bacterium]
MHISSFRKTVCLLALFAFANQVIVPHAHGAIIGTDEAVAAEARNADLARISRVLSDQSVQQRLVSMGVEPAAAEARLAALTNAELARIADELEQAPAGGDALALIGAVFLVLLILELTGVIDIFKKV